MRWNCQFGERFEIAAFFDVTKFVIRRVRLKIRLKTALQSTLLRKLFAIKHTFYPHPDAFDVHVQVADLGAIGSGLPQVEKFKLHVQASLGMKSEMHREVVQYYQYSADRGNVDAQSAVGRVFNYGSHGVSRDHASALHYLKSAAQGGDAEAMAHLGHMHANGFGTPQDHDVALRWFRAAAGLENANAHFGLGYLHLMGLGVAQDHEAAFKHFSKVSTGKS